MTWGNNALKFNQTWPSSKLLLTRFRTPREARPLLLYTEGRRGVCPCWRVYLKCDTHWWHLMWAFVGECHLLENPLIFVLQFQWLRCPSRREISLGNFFILLLLFGYWELKVGRERRVKVFNGFINAWFDFSKYMNLWLCRYLGMIKEEEKYCGFLYYHFFQKKQKIKDKVGNKATFY